MQNQFVAEINPMILGHKLHQLVLNLHRIVLLGQAEPQTQSPDMCIDHDTAGDAKAGAEDDVGRLAADAGEFDEGVEIARDLAAVVRDDSRAGGFDVLGFVAKKTG